MSIPELSETGAIPSSHSQLLNLQEGICLQNMSFITDSSNRNIGADSRHQNGLCFFDFLKTSVFGSLLLDLEVDLLLSAL